MQEIKFSVVLPTCDRVSNGKLRRALNSLDKQTYSNFEVLVVDDGTRESAESLVSAYDDRFKYLRNTNHSRVVARNLGMSEAGGDFIAWLDDDDAYDQEYLRTFAYHIHQEPETKLWVCGAIVHGVAKDEEGRHLVPVWTRLRQAWTPPLNEGKELPWVHAHFPSGTVGTGMFVFARECLFKTGLMPAWKTHLDIADGVDEWLGYRTGYSAAKRWVGNPWGDDWAFFRKLTMFFKARAIEACLYIHYVR